MVRLFVDDCRNPNWVYGDDNEGPWVVARNYDQAIEELSKNDVKVVSLDYDLGRGKTGLAIARWLEDRVLEDGIEAKVPETILVHSSHPDGKKEIQSVIENIKCLRDHSRGEAEENLLNSADDDWL